MSEPMSDLRDESARAYVPRPRGEGVCGISSASEALDWCSMQADRATQVRRRTRSRCAGAPDVRWAQDVRARSAIAARAPRTRHRCVHCARADGDCRAARHVRLECARRDRAAATHRLPPAAPASAAPRSEATSDGGGGKGGGGPCPNSTPQPRKWLICIQAHTLHSPDGRNVHGKDNAGSRTSIVPRRQDNRVAVDDVDGANRENLHMSNDSLEVMSSRSEKSDDRCLRSFRRSLTRAAGETRRIARLDRTAHGIVTSAY
jgi:hypothetical protein